MALSPESKNVMQRLLYYFRRELDRIVLRCAGSKAQTLIFGTRADWSGERNLVAYSTSRGDASVRGIGISFACATAPSARIGYGLKEEDAAA